MTNDELTLQRPVELGREKTTRPIAVEVRRLEKTFRIPEQRVDTLKERATHLFRRVGYRELHALQQVSFDIHRGEFFGIVGRNGSGKSTLLKILASIYQADAGTVRMAGRVAPFIELGVGFNPELTARENAVLNGVLMGLTMREARRRLDAILDFGELHEFVDLKLKNYSSGMMVRLAFAIMVQADADIMLIDEVLAVGDAAFAQKCMDVFHERRTAGKTIVLVTHDMSTVQSICDRAMVLHDGELQYIGEPEDTALRYYRINFAGPLVQEEGKPPSKLDAVHELNARVLEANVVSADGRATEGVEQGTPISIRLEFEVARALNGPIFVFHVLDAEGTVVFSFVHTLAQAVPAGRRIVITGTIENRLVAGRYHLDCWIRNDENDLSVMAIQALRLTGFVVFGTAPRHGVVLMDAELDAVVEGE